MNLAIMHASGKLFINMCQDELPVFVDHRKLVIRRKGSETEIPRVQHVEKIDELNINVIE
jgi:hypothetical protein